MAMLRSAIERAAPGPTASLKTWLRARFGLWPVLEVRNRVVSAPSSMLWSVFERREAARLAPAADRLPSALVTTVIPTFRRPDLLPRAVESALAQTVRDQVVVVVDDGGADLPELPADERLLVVSLSRNSRRLGLVRNVGIRLTSSRYLAFLDDDNEWYPRHLEVAIEALEDSADLVYTAVHRVRPDGSRMDTLSREFDRHALADHSGFVDANSVVVRRDPRTRFSVIRRSKAMLPKEDLEFVWRMSGHMRVRHVPEVTVRYLVNDASYYTSWGPREAVGP